MSDDANFLSLFSKETETRQLAAGEVLFKKGDAPDALYIVKTGELQIHDDSVVFETVGAGGLIGEMALVDKSPRSASVRAVGPAEVIPINEKRFLWMVEQTPRFALRVMRVLSQRLRVTDARLRELSR